MLTIRLFGEFECLLNNDALNALAAPRLQAFVAFLLLHRAAPVSRQQLAYQFWPESSDAQARTNLRNLIAQFRTALPNSDHYLTADPRTLQWRTDATYTLDVVTFQTALAHARQSHPLAASRDPWDAVLAIYRGDLLPHIYDDWLTPFRDQLRNDYLSTLEGLSSVLEAQRNYPAALEVAQRILQADQLRETSYARLMKLYAAHGDRATALRVYHTCATMLIRELGVEPSPMLATIYERLLKVEDRTPLGVLPSATTLVGRDAAWVELQRAWQRANHGQAHLLLISGEAGIGKTRLAEELLEWVGRQGYACAIAHCYRTAGGLALAPVVDWLRNPLFQSAITTLDAARLDDLARLMPEVAHPTMRNTLASPGNDALQRQRLFAVLAHLIHAHDQPLLLAIDDLQWCDSETLDWLHYMLKLRPQARVLLLGTVRDDEITTMHPLQTLLLPLRRSDLLTELALERFDLPLTTQLAASLTGHMPDTEAAAALFLQTEGNPLFIVESVRAQLTTEHPNTAALPPKVHAVIVGRLAQLSLAARHVIEVAAVIGRSFTFDVLAHASEHNEDALALGLDELWQHKIVQTQNADFYDFTHDKLREVAYSMLSPAWRRLLHQRVARALAQLAADDLDRVSVQLAYHYEQSAQFPEAITNYQRAAAVAHRRSALEAAIRYLQHALQLVPRLPIDTKRNQIELEVQVALGPVLLARRGYSAPEVEQTLQRASVIGRTLGSPTVRFRILWGLGRFYLVQPNLKVGLGIGYEMLGLAEDAKRIDWAVEAHNLLGAIYFHLGDLPKAYQHLHATTLHYDPVRHREHAWIYGQEPGIVSQIRLAWTLWHLGETAKAHHHCEIALAMIDASDHPFSRVFGWVFAAGFYQFCRDVSMVDRLSIAALELSREHGFTIYIGVAEQMRAWVLLQQGALNEALTLFRFGWARYIGTGSLLVVPYFATFGIEIYAQLGRTSDAVVLAEEALDLIARTQERWIAPEVLRLKTRLVPHDD
jgi:DNA-binding SARP family transcriptional activator